MQDFIRRNHYLLRRLHSLSGIVPVGGFLLFHLYENAQAMRSPALYNESIRAINSLPMVWVLEVLFIFIPLYFHAIYGIYIAADAKYNVSNYGYGRNWAFFFQRLTGIITLFFVTYHIWHFRFQKLIGAFGTYVGGDSMSGLPSFDIVKAAFANNIVVALYLVGVVAAAYHLCNGVYTFLITWGITIGPKSQRISNVITNAAFVAVSALGIVAVFAFR
ncbi:MAG: succinate dehydrogenase cytochrome b558 subunit [Firmicutes bacterium]|nr:succinate dehydrogenase cytochrome b558 subunit [Bacillota bacterium]